MKGDLSQNLKQYADRMLLRWGTPQNRLTDARKKLGRGMIIVACMIVLPGMFWKIPLIPTLFGQLAWGFFLFVGITLATDEKEPKKS